MGHGQELGQSRRLEIPTESDVPEYRRFPESALSIGHFDGFPAGCGMDYVVGTDTGDKLVHQMEGRSSLTLYQENTVGVGGDCRVTELDDAADVADNGFRAGFRRDGGPQCLPFSFFNPFLCCGFTKSAIRANRIAHQGKPRAGFHAPYRPQPALPQRNHICLSPAEVGIQIATTIFQPCPRSGFSVFRHAPTPALTASIRFHALRYLRLASLHGAGGDP